ncbi:MAG: hypothetical protein ABF893_01785 [Gluconacetobacter liquefaciens]
MAAMILAMLFIGIIMASTVAPTYHRLLDPRRPLGIYGSPGQSTAAARRCAAIMAGGRSNRAMDEPAS